MCVAQDLVSQEQEQERTQAEAVQHQQEGALLQDTSAEHERRLDALWEELMNIE